MSRTEKCSKGLDENVGAEEEWSNKSEKQKESSIEFFTKSESGIEIADVVLNEEKTTTPNQTQMKIGKCL